MPSPARCVHRAFDRGFTLIELLLVMVIVGVASVGITFSLRDSAQTQLQREADRLIALLEAARAHSRSTGVPVRWRPQASGFVFEGTTGESAWPTHWNAPTTMAWTTAPLILGPEPIIGAQSVVIQHREASQRSLRIATDGLRPFHIEAAP